MIIGLCGRSGSGKTTVSEIFKTKGFNIIDADKIARLAVEKGSPALEELTDEFGADILNSDGSLNRAVLFEVSMRDTESHKKLGEITYRYITEIIDNIIIKNKKSTVVDAPTLFESGFDKRCDIIIGVVSEEKNIVERIKNRDKLDTDKISMRLSRMKDNEFLRKNCHMIIENNGTAEDLKSKAAEVAGKILEMEKK